MMDNPIENKVAKSGLITIDLEKLFALPEIVHIDLTDVLWQGLVLKEKDFRQYVTDTDWSAYKGKAVYITCSSEAIIPTWAYMLLAIALGNHTNKVVIGDRSDLLREVWRERISSLDLEPYLDQRVVIKGCSDQAIPEGVYYELAARLAPVVNSMMYGEPCSTVPLMKRKA